MQCKTLYLKLLPALAFSLCLLPSLSQAQHYKETKLVSDSMGTAAVFDPNLKNPWGLTRSPSGSPWWIGNNNSGTSSLYNGTGNPINIFTESGGATGNFVIVPPPGFAPGTQSTPTGVVFNGSPTDFILDKGSPAGLPAVFIFATEDGTISGWNPGANLAMGASPPSTHAVLEVDHSAKGSPNGAVYKGATSGEINGHRFFYVTNFRSGKVEVYDTNFKPVDLGHDAFELTASDDHDPESPASAQLLPGFAPFNIQNIGGTLFVTYAKQDGARHDDVAGDGHGFVVIFTTSGQPIGHLEYGPWLNSPWGVVWTTRDFGEFSNAILVGNFGSGRIAAFNGFTYKFMGFVKNPNDSILTIDGLWSLTFGNDGTAGPANTLFFTAGPNGEQDGLFGTLTPIDGLDGDEE
jgi:uncharacterized protein (TIGR03118 family)